MSYENNGNNDDDDVQLSMPDVVTENARILHLTLPLSTFYLTFIRKSIIFPPEFWHLIYNKTMTTNYPGKWKYYINLNACKWN